MADVDSLELEVQQLTNRVKTLEDDYKTLKSTVDNHTTTLASHTTTLAEHKETLDDHEERVTYLEDWKKENLDTKTVTLTDLNDENKAPQENNGNIEVYLPKNISLNDFKKINVDNFGIDYNWYKTISNINLQGKVCFDFDDRSKDKIRSLIIGPAARVNVPLKFTVTASGELSGLFFTTPKNLALKGVYVLYSPNQSSVTLYNSTLFSVKIQADECIAWIQRTFGDLTGKDTDVTTKTQSTK